MFTRRDGLKLTGAALASGAAFGLGGCENKNGGMHIWEGEALGAPATMKLYGHDEAGAHKLFAGAVLAIEQLEKIFSLYDPSSEISRLNRDGKLENASPEMIEVLKSARRISEQTGGAFDITVQPLWELQTFLMRAKVTQEGQRQLWAEAYAKVDYRFVRIDDRKVSFTKPGVKITLNGIAQGYISEDIAPSLNMLSTDTGLVHFGEYQAFGSKSWKISLQDPHNVLDVIDMVSLKNAGLATSSSKGGFFGPERSHIFTASETLMPPKFISATVIHTSAMIADGLATAFTLMDEDHIRSAAQMLDVQKVVLVKDNGEIIRF